MLLIITYYSTLSYNTVTLYRRGSWTVLCVYTIPVIGAMHNTVYYSNDI